MDKDTGSIGMLKNPPPAEKELFYMSIVLDIIGIAMTGWASMRLIPLMMIYSGVSRIYSWRKTRLKKYPVSGWLTVIIFQGAFTFMLVSMAVENNISTEWFSTQKAEAMIICTMLIGAYYPLTQIYQHVEDSERGDRTISLALGIRGTFIFSAVMFLLAFIVVFHYLKTYYTLLQFLLFMILLIPAIVFFTGWLVNSFYNRERANYLNAMRMTMISSTCLLIIFSIFLYINHYQA